MVEAEEVKTALGGLALAHGEEKVTVCGVVTGIPALITVTLTLVVPNAEIEDKPNTGGEIVRLGRVTAPTVKPIKEETVTPPTWAVAVIVAAPPTVPTVAARLIVATPAAFVNAVPEVGVMVAKFALVVKVTTTLGTTAPTASRTVAVTCVGSVVEASAIVTPAVGTAAGAAAPPPVVVAAVGVPLPHPASTANVAAIIHDEKLKIL